MEIDPANVCTTRYQRTPTELLTFLSAFAVVVVHDWWSREVAASASTSEAGEVAKMSPLSLEEFSSFSSSNESFVVVIGVANKLIEAIIGEEVVVSRCCDSSDS